MKAGDKQQDQMLARGDENSNRAETSNKQRGDQMNSGGGGIHAQCPAKAKRQDLMLTRGDRSSAQTETGNKQREDQMNNDGRGMHAQHLVKA